MEDPPMGSFQQNMQEFRKQLQKGAIQKAYAGLLQYVLDLRAHFEKKHPEYPVSGIYSGYMDMTYFALFPPALKERKLKIAIVFNYEAFRFEVWLAAVNRQVQGEYFRSFTASGWDQYPVVPPAKGVDAILAHVLVAEPDFGDLDALTRQIESGTMRFTQDVESWLAGH